LAVESHCFRSNSEKLGDQDYPREGRRLTSEDFYAWTNGNLDSAFFAFSEHIVLQLIGLIQSCQAP